MTNSPFIDDVKAIGERNTYYACLPEDGYGTNVAQSYESCPSDDETHWVVAGQDITIDRCSMNIESPEYLIYHIYLYMLEREVTKLAQLKCNGCFSEEMSDYKSHINSGCMDDWEVKLIMNFDDAKANVREQYIVDLFQRVCEYCKLPTHPHMNNLAHMLCEYGHVTGEILGNYNCPEPLRFVIQSVYEEDTTK